MNIGLATIADIDNWMRLVDEIKDNFPGLETKDALDKHRQTVFTFIENKEAICAYINQQMAGILLFSKAHHELCFLAVSPQYRRLHIGEKMISFMLEMIDDDQDITVTTYCQEDLRGKAARAFYKHIGFIEGRLKEEFGTPVQEFIFKRNKKI